MCLFICGLWYEFTYIIIKCIVVKEGYSMFYKINLFKKLLIYFVIGIVLMKRMKVDY